MAVTEDRKPVPRDRENDYSREAAQMRREFLREQTGASLEHVAGFSFDPSVLPGNVEQFVGVAQVPRASSTSRWPRPRARWSRRTTAG